MKGAVARCVAAIVAISAASAAGAAEPPPPATDWAAALRRDALRWRPLPDADWARCTAPVAEPPRPPIGSRVLADGTRWFSMSDFDGDLAGDAAKALQPMIAAMGRDRVAIVSSRRVVLDLRGNGGGSSDWSAQIAAILWGRAAVDALPDDRDHVDWRASAANVATLADYAERFGKAPDASPAIKAYFVKAAAGIARAHAAGAPLWREPDDLYQAPREPPGPPAPPPAAPVYVLTDWSCASACLDAVDLWKSLGAVQIGQETSADTLYMDVRQDALPGGRLRASVPMKVYRDRPRGADEPQRPRFAYAGDMRDEAALAAWIGGLR